MTDKNVSIQPVKDGETPSRKENEGRFSIQPVDNDKQGIFRGEEKRLGGAPGIHVPEHPEEISAFQNERNVDAKALNEQIQAEGNNKKQENTGAPGIHLPKNPDQVEAFKEFDDRKAVDLNK